MTISVKYVADLDFDLEGKRAAELDCKGTVLITDIDTDYCLSYYRNGEINSKFFRRI